jgi:hypothetical protein
MESAFIEALKQEGEKNNQEEYKKLTSEQIEDRKAAIEWYRNPAAEPRQGAVWVKASERLPGWAQKVKWRVEDGEVLPGENALSDMTSPFSLEGFEWLDEVVIKEVKQEGGKPKYYTDEELRAIISMVCDQLNEGFNGREEFIDQTIADFADGKAKTEELRKQGVKHPSPHICDNKSNCGYPGCRCLPF